MNINIENELYEMERARVEFYRAKEKLNSAKIQLAEFVLLNKDSIDKIDLSAYYEAIENANLTIEYEEKYFLEMKAKLVNRINAISI